MGIQLSRISTPMWQAIACTVAIVIVITASNHPWWFTVIMGIITGVGGYYFCRLFNRRRGSS